MGFFSSSSTTTTNPYGAAKPGINKYLGYVAGQDWQGYNDPLVAGMNPAMQNALAGMNQFGTLNGMGGQYAQNMMNMGMGALNTGMGGYQDQLSALQNRGPAQFSFDQGTYNTMMNNYMPGLRSAVDAQGKLSSMALGSNLGQLTSAAGAQSGALGANPLSKLGQGGAALQAQTALNNQQFAAGLYNTANQQASSAGMNAGLQNMNALNRRDGQLLSGYGQLANMGRGMAQAGYGAGLNNLGLGLKAGQIQQGYDQSLLDAEFNRYKNNVMGQQAFNLNALQGLTNTGSAFSSQTTTSNPSGLQKLGGLAQLGGSLYSGFGGMGGMSGLFGGGGSSPYGFGQGQVGFSDPMEGWWM